MTTTNKAIEALKMLNENKDRFDLIITDVHMPDMDGFQLMERMGLNMDLPVISKSLVFLNTSNYLMRRSLLNWYS